MYTREILPPRASPVENGNPVFGTWSSAFEKVDLLEIQGFYRFPLPRWARGYLIKESQCFNVQNDHFILDAAFYDFKLYRMVRIFVFDVKNNEKFFYKVIKPLSLWRLPNSLQNASVDSNHGDFYFRIHDWFDAGSVKLDINIEASRRRPALNVHLSCDISRNISPMAVLMGMAARRSVYAYKTLALAEGEIAVGQRRVKVTRENFSSFFRDYKGYYPGRARTTVCSAAGFDEKNRRFGFHIAENQTRDTNKSNENALWVDGKLTPLPPVIVTTTRGQDNSWVIQDVEGMVDLTFKTREQIKSGMRFFITGTEITTAPGYYNGTLVSADGAEIQVKNLFGIGEKIDFRV